jgi:hypothetical protein
MSDEILDHLLGVVKPPERGHRAEAKAKAKSKPPRVVVFEADGAHILTLSRSGRRHLGSIRGLPVQELEAGMPPLNWYTNWPMALEVGDRVFVLPSAPREVKVR